MTLSRMTLGTVQLGMNYGVANTHGQPSRDESFSLLDKALTGGVNCLDTARHYGDSERILGEYLSSQKTKDTLIVTKFKLENACRNAADVLKSIRESVDESRRLLGLERLPLLLLHNADDMHALDGAVPTALRELKALGLVDRLGVSVYEGAQVDAMLNDDLYEAVQIPMNVLDSRLIEGGQMKRLRDAGIAVFVRSVFLQGVFHMRDLPPGFSAAKEPVERLRRLAERAGCSVPQLALIYIRDMPGISSLVLGSETAQQVSENLDMFDMAPLRQEITDEISEIARVTPIREIMRELLAR